MFQGVENMDIYNMSHCKDLTAAIAIMRADKPRGVKRSRVTWPGLTYRIGEVYRLGYENGMVTLWE